MDPKDTSNPRLLSLDARRTIMRRENRIRTSIEKAGVLRSLLDEGIAVYKRGSRAERQIVGFALHDALQGISDDDIQYLKRLLRSASTGSLD